MMNPDYDATVLSHTRSTCCRFMVERLPSRHFDMASSESLHKCM